MAADFEKLSACENNKTNNKCYKSFGGSRIRCKSRTNLSNDTDTILSEVEQIINRNAHWSDDEKDRFRKRFREVSFSHIRPLGAAGALAVDICICFHHIES